MNEGAIAVADIDNDSDLDVLVTGSRPVVGSEIDFESKTRLYENDGLGNFNPVSEPLIADVSGGDLAFTDIDNDGDMDLLLTGGDFRGAFYPIIANTELYLNIGQSSAIPNREVTRSTIDFAIYPNPTTAGELRVILSQPTRAAITLFDLLGQAVIVQSFSAGEPMRTITFDLSGIAAGTYVVEVSQGQKFARKLLFVQE